MYLQDWSLCGGLTQPAAKNLPLPVYSPLHSGMGREMEEQKEVKFEGLDKHTLVKERRKENHQVMQRHSLSTSFMA